MSLADDIGEIQGLVAVPVDKKFGPVTAAAVLRVLRSQAQAPREEGDARTARAIATLDPKAQGRFREFMRHAKATAAAMGCDYVLISGHRTWEEQDRLFEQRPRVTKAAGGYSNHNFGIAADAGVFRGGDYLDQSEPGTAEKVHRACAMHAAGLGLEWGGEWKKFPDFPHYEVKTGLTMAAKRALYQKHGSVL